MDAVDFIGKGSSGFDAGANVIRAHLKSMPVSPGVYRMLSEDRTVLYVGKAKNLKKRVVSYTQIARLPNRLQRMVAQVRDMEIVVTQTETEALLLEADLIQRFMPPFNILLRDDKSYPYILITRDHDFPQLLKHRGAQRRKGWYFGPFASGTAVNETINLLQRGFMLRSCSDNVFAGRSRPCLQYHIKRCTAPCAGKIGKPGYAAQVAEARAFLKGQSDGIKKKLAKEMQSASDREDFEKAAKLRDRIKAIASIQSQQDITVSNIKDADIIAAYQSSGRTAIQIFFFRAGRNYGTRTYFPVHDKHMELNEIISSFIAQFYVNKPAPPVLLLNLAPIDRSLLASALSERAEHKVSIITPTLGDKKRLVALAEENAKTAISRKLSESSEQAELLKRIAEIFHMDESPKRIEVYDNSHTGGSYAIGAMIAAGPEGFLKKTYRKFNIRDAAPDDDCAMMKEVLGRRFQRLVKEDVERATGMWPDLVLIDGGQSQLNQAIETLNELGLSDIAVVGIAKGPDRNAGRERFFMRETEPFSLPHNDPVLYYLQRLRDEAHRFAIGTHRKKRAKSIEKSGMEEIPGIGKARKRQLLHHFGSAKAASEATLSELAKAPGISGSTAKKIHDYFHAR
ncbi:MAG: excinuclease ABC subunit UvrC [Alphaproteobacteria bacterium]|nr:excinuclease ABC subunit UvrC [Alphaproteobacteria bacterium]